MPSLLQPRATLAVGRSPACLGVVTERRTCDGCRRRRQCFLMLHLASHTSAWLCCAGCARHYSRFTRIVFIEE